MPDLRGWVTERAPPSPLATPRETPQAETPRRSSSIADIGVEGNSFNSTRQSREVCRYHVSSDKVCHAKALITPRAAEVSHAVREQMRFIDPLSSSRSSSLQSRQSGNLVQESATESGTASRGAAGIMSARCRRVESVNTLTSSRRRSATPDYHERYSLNCKGSSLPGSTASLAEPATQAATPHSPVLIWPPTAARASQEVCRYHGALDAPQKAFVSKQAFNISSSELPRPLPTPLSARQRPTPAKGGHGAALLELSTKSQRTTRAWH